MNQIERKILKNQRLEINKLSKRVMVLESRISNYEDEYRFLRQDFDWQNQDIKELEKIIERLKQSVNTVQLEKMIFNPD